MFALSESHRFYLYADPTDMRKSFDGLCGLVANELGDRPDNGSVYIFVNKLRNKCKLLQWQSGGFVLYYKRLEKGSFEFFDYDKSVKSLVLSYSQLVLLIDGVSIGHMGRRTRYKKVEKAMV